MSEPTGIQRVWAWVRSPAARRWLALLTVAVGTAALSMEYAPQSTAKLKVGDVADRSVKAHASFPFKDWEATLSRQRKAEAGVPPVFDFDATLAGRVNTRLAGAFETARLRHAEALAKEPAGVSPDVLEGIGKDFLTLLDLSLGEGALRRERPIRSPLPRRPDDAR